MSFPCPRCGGGVEPQAYLCGHCGADVTVTATFAPRQSPPSTNPYWQQSLNQPQADIGQDPAMRMLLPVGRSMWAIAAGYLGLFSLIGCAAPFAIFCGIMALRDIKQHPQRHGKGRAIFGIVMGVIGLPLFAVLVIGIIGAASR